MTHPVSFPLRRWLTFAMLFVTSIAATAVAQDRRGPFTHEPRSVRSRDIDMQHIRLELALDWDDQSIDGRAVLRLSPFKPLSEITLDASDMKVESVTRISEDNESEQKLDFQQHPGELEITLDREHSAGETMTLAIEYRVEKPQHGGHFVVPDDNEPHQARSFWTQSEPEFAQYWYPCIDSPTDRVTSETIVTVPESYLVLSNGTLVDKSGPSDGRRTWHWVQEKTHVPYLFSVVAGEFAEYRQEWNGLEVVSYVPQQWLDDAARSFEKTPAMLTYFSDAIGVRYPWPKYAQICVDEYMWGGMEHTSATTLTLRTLHDERAALDVSSDNLVAHELAHQWFGDMLTCKDWGELWLNESFATYFATLWQEHDRGRDEATWTRHNEAESYKNEDRRRYRRPIVTYRYPEPDAMFDRHSYPKGGRVLHMLRYELGDEAFWKAIHRYTHGNQFRTVETADLREAIEAATGQGMNWFFDQWVYHGGHPEFEVSYDYDRGADVVRMTVKQTQTVNDLTPLFRTSVDVEIVTPDETITRRVTVQKAEETFTFDVPQRPLRMLFDPEDWILKVLTFEKSKQELLNQLAEDKRIMCRVRAIEGLAEYKPDSDVREALATAAREDDFWAVREQAVRVLGEFAGDEVRAVLIEAAQKDDKSDVRRAAVRALRDFPHDETKDALRQIVKEDRSYFAAADALGSLVEVDKENVSDDLYAALERDSHQEVILRAAAEGLAETEDPQALEKLLAMLDPPSDPERRIAVMRAVARLGERKPEITETISKQLDDARLSVRRAAVEALAESGDPGAVALLLDRKPKEERGSMLQEIDDAVAKLRENSDVEQLQQRIQSLESDHRKLQEKLEELEESKAG